jgi:hypothetical protein
MADALLANWDVVGLNQDNVLWHDGEPIRVDQGGTLEYRAQGQTKDFGPVPSEVWSMAGLKGQAHGTMLLTPEIKRAGAAKIAELLTPDTIDELVNVAPFKDLGMKERVRENLKARIDWMGKYANGEVGEPQPLEGDEAEKAFLGMKPKWMPEEEHALDEVGAGGLGSVNEHLRSGTDKAASKDMARVIKGLDSALGYSKAPEDIHAWLAVPSPPHEGTKLVDKGYLIATLDADDARKAAGQTGGVVRVLIPQGKGVLYLPQAAGLDKRWVLLKRGAAAKVVKADGTDGDAVLL